MNRSRYEGRPAQEGFGSQYGEREDMRIEELPQGEEVWNVCGRTLTKLADALQCC